MILECSDLEIEQDVLNNNWSEKIPCNDRNVSHYLSSGHFANFISETKSLVLKVIYDDVYENEDGNLEGDVFYLLSDDCRYELTDFAYFQTSKKWFDVMQSRYPNYNPKGETE